MNTKLADILSKSFLFDKLSVREVCELLSPLDLTLKEYHKDEIIYSPTSFEMKVGFVISGECIAVKKHEGFDDIPLNSMVPGASFGVLTCFTNIKEYPTYIIAIKDSLVAFLSKESIIKLVKKNGTVALNILNFMGNRINFLNDKISSFSSPSIEIKLATFLLQEYRKNGDNIKISKVSLAKTLGTGRASVYRTIDKLKNEGIIECNAKFIKILNPLQLERISK